MSGCEKERERNWGVKMRHENEEKESIWAEKEVERDQISRKEV